MYHRYRWNSTWANRVRMSSPIGLMDEEWVLSREVRFEVRYVVVGRTGVHSCRINARNRAKSCHMKTGPAPAMSSVIHPAFVSLTVYQSSQSTWQVGDPQGCKVVTLLRSFLAVGSCMESVSDARVRFYSIIHGWGEGGRSRPLRILPPSHERGGGGVGFRLTDEATSNPLWAPSFGHKDGPRKLNLHSPNYWLRTGESWIDCCTAFHKSCLLSLVGTKAACYSSCL